MRKSVESSEWALILSLALILTSLFIVSQINNHRSTPNLTLSPLSAPPSITVTLSGAVHRPGSYTVEEGTPLNVVLRKARPKIHANLKPYDLNAPLSADAALHIDELALITITVDGATLTVPVGTRICDLKNILSLPPSADKQFFKKRRQLRDGESIQIPHFQTPLATNSDLVYDPTPYFSHACHPKSLGFVG